MQWYQSDRLIGYAIYTLFGIAVGLITAFIIHIIIVNT